MDNTSQRTKNKKIADIVKAIIPTIAVLATFLFVKDNNLLFFGNIILAALIIIKSKFSFFSLKAMLIAYVLVAIFWQYNFGQSYGILEMNEYKIDYYTANIIPLIYLSLFYVYISCSGVIEKERQKLANYSNKKLSNLSICLLSIIAITSAIIAFPAIIVGGNRFDSLLPGNAWNHITVIALLLLYPVLRTSVTTKIAYGFCLLWFVFQGERVDVIGLLCGVIIMTAAAKGVGALSKKSILKFIKYAILFVAIILSAVYVGEKRAGVKEMNMVDMTQKVIVQNTASDIGYIYNLSIKHRRMYGNLNGETYIHYIDELLPFGDDENSAAKLLDKRYGTPGGIYLLSEPYMNFGFSGIILFFFAEICLVSILLSAKNKYSFIVYVYILSTAFRTSWYGISYIETGILYILPTLSLLTYFIDKKALARTGH